MGLSRPRKNLGHSRFEPLTPRIQVQSAMSAPNSLVDGDAKPDEINNKVTSYIVIKK